jgi:hypothetical protein
MTDQVNPPVTPEVPGSDPAQNEQNAPQRPENVPEQFWDAEKGAVNTDALLAFYAEKSKPAEETPPVTPEADPNAPPQPDPNAPPEHVAKYNATVEKATAELQSETGVISEETYADFAAQGITREQIDTYVEGQQAKFELRQLHMHTEVGGAETYNALLAWGASNYTAEEIEAFNNQVFGASKDEAAKAVRALKQRYEDNMGIDPKLVTNGTGIVANAGYKNKAEWMADIRKPEYKKDPAVRESVRVKLEAALKAGVDMGVGVSVNG